MIADRLRNVAYSENISHLSPLTYHLFRSFSLKSITHRLHLTNEELSQNVLPNLNSIGQLVLHLGESEYWWIQEIVGGKPMSDDEKKFAHFNPNGFEDFTGKNYSAYYVIEKLNQIHALTRKLLAQFSDADLDNIYVLKKKIRKFI